MKWSFAYRIVSLRFSFRTYKYIWFCFVLFSRIFCCVTDLYRFFIVDNAAIFVLATTSDSVRYANPMFTKQNETRVDQRIANNRTHPKLKQIGYMFENQYNKIKTTHNLTQNFTATIQIEISPQSTFYLSLIQYSLMLFILWCEYVDEHIMVCQFDTPFNCCHLLKNANKNANKKETCTYPCTMQLLFHRCVLCEMMVNLILEWILDINMIKFVLRWWNLEKLIIGISKRWRRFHFRFTISEFVSFLLCV